VQILLTRSTVLSSTLLDVYYGAFSFFGASYCYSEG